MKQQVIYWAHLAQEYRQGHMNLLNGAPELLMKDLAKDRLNFKKAYTNCVALHEQLNNTYYVKFPFDLDIQVPKPDVFEGEKAGLIAHGRPDNFNNRSTVDLDFGWFFYSPNPLIMEIMPPFAHNTKVSQYGMMTHGAFDIGQWFRPIRATHILWSDVKEFKAKENDPIMYIRFNTDKPVLLKQFILNPNLLSYSSACVDYSEMKHYKIPLKQRYLQFKSSGMRNMILNEIEKNLIKENK
jgi:hypothetical protein